MPSRGHAKPRRGISVSSRRGWGPAASEVKVDLPFELHIALRYLLAKRKQAFISVISLVSTIGVTVGVMAVIIALAVMTGLQESLRDRILGSQPHVYVSRTGGLEDYRVEVEKLRSVPHVTGVAPAMLGKALISGTRGEDFITIKGIDPALEPSVTDISRTMVAGSLSGLAQPTSAPGDAVSIDGIVLGKDLASALGVVVGDSVHLTTPQGRLSPLGLNPSVRRLRVVGIFSLGLFEFDSTYGFISLDVAKRMLDRRQVDFIQLHVDDIYGAPQVARAVAARLGDQYYAQDWGQMNKALFSALTLEKLAVSMAIGLIVMVAALNIVATLILLVMEKHRDIAILKTMGAGARSVTAIFMMQGLLIGAVGTVVGAALGLGVSYICNKYELIRVPTDVYQVSYMPFTVLAADFAVVVIAAVLICFVATIYPSRQAARLDPAEALRHE
jgi:lipoprotein-releasing system permease protein